MSPGARRELVIGYDGSAHGEDGLALGGLLAKVLGATALVATVLPYPDHLLDSDTVEATVREEAAPLLEIAADRLRDLDVETRGIVDDSPARALHELAETERATVIVLGSTHLGPMGRVFIGSVGDALLSGAPCGVAVAPRGYATRDEHRLRRMAVPVNGSAESWTALGTAVSFAERLHGSLDLVAVAEPPRVVYGGTLAAGAESHRMLAEDTKRRVLGQALTRTPPDLRVKQHLVYGEPAAEIADAAAASDLLIVGSRGYGPIRRALLGGVSAKLVRSATCPVLVLPRGAGDDPLGFSAVDSASSAAQ